MTAPDARERLAQEIRARHAGIRGQLEAAIWQAMTEHRNCRSEADGSQCALCATLVAQALVVADAYAERAVSERFALPQGDAR